MNGLEQVQVGDTLEVVDFRGKLVRRVRVVHTTKTQIVVDGYGAVQTRWRKRDGHRVGDNGNFLADRRQVRVPEGAAR